MALKPILQTILNHKSIGGLTEFKEWVDYLIYTGDRFPKRVLLVYENESHYHYLVHDIIESIKLYGEPVEVEVNHSNRTASIVTHFITISITFVRWHQYDRIVCLHGISYVVLYLPQCETFLQRLLITTMP
jgi:hypothetical protein